MIFPEGIQSYKLTGVLHKFWGKPKFSAVSWLWIFPISDFFGQRQPEGIRKQ